MVRRAFGAAIAGVCLLLAPTPADAQTPANATIEDVMALRQLGAERGGLSLSPDGSWLAVFEQATDLARNDITYRLLLIRSDGAGGARAIGDGGGIIWHDENGRRSGAAIDRFVRWSPDGLSVAYLKRVDDRVELWRSTLDGEEMRVASLSGDIRDFSWLSPDRILVLEATPRETLAREAAANLAQGYRLADDLDIGFSQLPVPDVLEQSGRLVVDLATGATRPASDTEAAALTPAPDARPAWIAPRDPASQAAAPELGVFVKQGGAPLLCGVVECSGRLRDAGTLGDGRVWFVRGEGFDAGDAGVYIWSPVSQSVTRLRGGDELFYGCSGGQHQILCLWEAPAHPRRIVSIDPESGALRVLYDPNPAWNATTAPRIERITFTDDHGLQSYAHLIYPRGYRQGRRYPMVIVQYRSRGFLRGGTGGEYPMFAYAARGYFVMSFERPEATALSHTMSQRDFDHMLNFEGEEERMKLAALDGLIAEIERRGLVDDTRIALTGMSDGAETLYWALGRRSFAAAVASDPATDISHYWLVSEQFRQALHAQGIEPPWPAPRGWWLENAAALYADRIRTPLLMNLPQSEAVFAPPLQVRLRERNVAVESYLYPDAFHIKARPSQLLAAQRRAMAWIDFWLKDEIDADPSDPDRAERWRLMRRAMPGGEAMHPAANGSAAARSRQ
jgi:dipeptidyl aminopeptidase/acylaminoacyl peptidase